MPSMLFLMNCVRKAKGPIKYISLVISVLITLLGVGALVIGGLIIGKYKDYLTFVENKYVATAAFFVTVGLFVLIIGLLGIVGSVQCNEKVITAYGALLIIFFILEIVAGGLFFGYKGEVTEAVNRSMKDGLSKYYKNKADKKFYDWVQHKYTCCGNKGPEDWNLTGHDIPTTCCKHNTTDTSCWKQKDNVYSEGCQTKFEKFVKDELVFIGGFGIGIAMLELIGILMAFAFRKAIQVGVYEEIL